MRLCAALVVLVLPFCAEAQPTGKIPRMGWLAVDPYTTRARLNDAFRQGLLELGYVEGKNLVIEFRSAEKFDRLPALAAELVRRKVDVIFAPEGPQSALAAKNATSTIPIVMMLVTDPVALGLVDNLARPGGNITGLSVGTGPELHGKRLELLKETFPKVSRAAVLWDPANPGSVANKNAMEVPAQSLSIKLQSVEVRKPGDLEHAFSAMRRERAEALVTLSSPLIVTQLKRIVDLSAKSRLPAMYMDSRWVDGGGLMSYGPSYLDLYRRAASYVDKILKGANPSGLPIEQPTKFELVVNLKTAKALGLTIPPSLLLRVDQVIE
jgi:putative tryptophan/tyrosine transport system substrate-binding protein